MGLHYSKFIDAVQRGNEEEARSYYSTRKAVRDRVEPNTSLGPGHGENSILHYAAFYGMDWLFRMLLTHGGKPDMRNGAARNSLHLVCMKQNRPNRREAILRLILEEGLVGMDIEHVLRERDEDGNTALHLAASCGLNACVELLLENKADLYVTNKKEQTAADCAAACKLTGIATRLEARMVFSAEDEADPASPIEPDNTHLMELAEAPSGMRDSDLRSMKDQLLIETSELLGVSLFTSEALLRHHGWSKEQLVEAWMDNPTDACEKAGVQLPKNLGTHNFDTPSVVQCKGECSKGGEVEEMECGICVLSSAPDIETPCGHFFCRDCWRWYLHQKIEAGEAHSISCPEYGCFKLVPLEVIEGVVSREMAQRYLQFDIKAFVESHPTIRWCPFPNCHRAVRLTAPPNNPGHTPEPTTVHCGNEHYFCWNCSGEPHVPLSCEGWKQWLDHIQEMAPQIGERTATQLDDAASQRWLATRSKPCPKCRAPIEKTEGCNHMCCKKCKHDFCWMCLDEWKQHNTSTGGYFECNRYEVRRKADSQLQKHKAQVLEGVEGAEKLRRFIHFYERYKSHRESLQLEQPFLEKANRKTEALRASVAQHDSSHRYTISLPLDMSFIEEAIRELLAARRVLIASYAFGYTVRGRHAQRTFEKMQGTLEQVTELLAQVVARPHLRKPRADIIRLTRECREKRVGLVKECQNLSDPTPPSRRRLRHLLTYEGEDSDSSTNGSPDGPNSYGDLMRMLRRINLERHGTQHQDEMQRALQVSREEHDELAQLEADIERAKQLSLQESQSVQPAADVGLLFLGSATRPPDRQSPNKPFARQPDPLQRANGSPFTPGSWTLDPTSVDERPVSPFLPPSSHSQRTHVLLPSPTHVTPPTSTSHFPRRTRASTTSFGPSFGPLRRDPPPTSHFSVRTRASPPSFAPLPRPTSHFPLGTRASPPSFAPLPRPTSHFPLGTRASPPSFAPLRTSPPSLSPLQTSPPSFSPLRTSPPSPSPLRTSPPSLSPLRTSPPSPSPLRTSPPSLSPLRTSPPSPSPLRTSPQFHTDVVVPSSSSNDSDGWDDEELAQALSLSLMESLPPPTTTPGSAAAAAAGNSDNQQFFTLPPELQHLLQDNQRSGQNV